MLERFVLIDLDDFHVDFCVDHQITSLLPRNHQLTLNLVIIVMLVVKL